MCSIFPLLHQSAHWLSLKKNRKSYIILSCVTILELCENMCLLSRCFLRFPRHKEHHFAINKLLTMPNWLTGWFCGETLSLPPVVFTYCDAQSALWGQMQMSRDPSSCKSPPPPLSVVLGKQIETWCFKGQKYVLSADCCNAKMITCMHECFLDFCCF